MEKDAARLSQRQKQIDYGKNTLGYVNYLKAVPRCGALWAGRPEAQTWTHGAFAAIWARMGSA